MKIAIPYHSQKPGSQDCGPVCVQMILEHFNKKILLKDIVTQLSYGKMGTSAYQNGSVLLKNNLSVTATTAQPILFSPDIIKKLKTKS